MPNHRFHLFCGLVPALFEHEQFFIRKWIATLVCYQKAVRLIVNEEAIDIGLELKLQVVQVLLQKAFQCYEAIARLKVSSTTVCEAEHNVGTGTAMQPSQQFCDAVLEKGGLTTLIGTNENTNAVQIAMMLEEEKNFLKILLVRIDAIRVDHAWRINDSNSFVAKPEKVSHRRLCGRVAVRVDLIDI